MKFTATHGAIIGLAVVAIAAGIAFKGPKVSPAPQPVADGSAYTLTQVGAHGTQTSCWSAINGNVYDLTQWITEHPGGESAILSICGKDGSAAFNGQHGGMEKQAAILATFKIGTLTE